jgi:hypothetical protein
MNFAEWAMYKFFYFFLVSLFLVSGTMLLAFSEDSFMGRVFNTMFSLILFTIAAWLAAKVLFNMGGRVKKGRIP